MQVKQLLKLVRWPNLILVILLQALVYFRFHCTCSAIGEECSSMLTIPILIIMISVLVTAAGYVINDIKDLRIDKINKPEKMIVGKYFDTHTAYRLYWGLTIISGILTLILAYLLNQYIYFVFFLIASILLYSYSAKWKMSFLSGNLIVGLMCGITVIAILVPFWSEDAMEYGRPALKEVFLVLSWFAASLTVYREIVKDIEDMKGDQVESAHTMPLVLGIQQTKNWLLAFGFLIIGSLTGWFIYTINYLEVWQITSHFLLILAILFCQYLLFKAREKKDLHFISQSLKLIMVFGIIVFLLI